MAIRVMHFCPFMYYGGTERHLYNLLSRLPSEFESIVCAPTGPMTPMIESVADHMEPRLEPLRVKNLRIGQAVREVLDDIKKRLEDLRPGLVHVHISRETAFAIRKVAREIGMNCPVVLTPHVYTGSVDFLWTSLFARAVDKVIAVSDSERARLARLLPSSIRNERVVSIYNGTPLADCCIGAAASHVRSLSPEVLSSAAGEARSLEPESITIGTVGRLSKEKGTVYLLRAFSSLTGEFPNIRLVIVGGGSLREYLEQAAKSLGVADKVRFAGVMDDTSLEASQFDIFVSPSLNETLSMSIIEAMALGKPVVATRVGATHEAVVHGDTGILCKPRDPAELAQAIRALLISPETRRRMGEAGRQRAVNLFSAQRMADKTVGVYRELLASSA